MRSCTGQGHYQGAGIISFCHLRDGCNEALSCRVTSTVRRNKMCILQVTKAGMKAWCHEASPYQCIVFRHKASCHFHEYGFDLRILDM